MRTYRLDLLSAAFVLAALWVIAAHVRVPHELKPDKDEWFLASISVGVMTSSK